MNMIDLHSHILPGLDDGPASVDECLEMCRIAEGDGIRTLAATPHTQDGLHDVGIKEMLSGVEELNRLLRSEGMRLRVVPGAEVHVCTELASLYEAGRLATINGTEYLLVEFPGLGIPQGFDKLFFHLRLLGARLIIAHPERYQQVQGRPESLDRYIEQGALVQVTGGALLGNFGGRVRKCARHLLRTGRVHLLASDAHSRRSRPPRLSEALNEAARLLGSRAEALRLVRETPLEILSSGACSSHADTLANRRDNRAAI